MTRPRRRSGIDRAASRAVLSAGLVGLAGIPVALLSWGRVPSGGLVALLVAGVLEVLLITRREDDRAAVWASALAPALVLLAIAARAVARLAPAPARLDPALDRVRAAGLEPAGRSRNGLRGAGPRCARPALRAPALGGGRGDDPAVVGAPALDADAGAGAVVGRAARGGWFRRRGRAVRPRGEPPPVRPGVPGRPRVRRTRQPAGARDGDGAHAARIGVLAARALPARPCARDGRRVGRPPRAGRGPDPAARPGRRAPGRLDPSRRRRGGRCGRGPPPRRRPAARAGRAR